MKFRVSKPFIAFGMAPESGEIINLNAEQAQALLEARVVAPYEVKVKPPMENKRDPKQSGSSQPAHRSRKKTAKRSKRIVTK